MAKRSFSPEVLEAIRTGKYLWIRAGQEHRFIAIWAVVAGNRVFIRSWNVKPGGWHAAFAKEKRGAIKLAKDGPEIAVVATRTRSERVKADVDRAFAGKYVTPSSLEYVKGFRLARRRDTTTELAPASKT